MNLCTRFQHPRSGTFSCVTIFNFHNNNNNNNESLQLLIAGDTDGLVHFFNLKTMKQIAVLNIHDATVSVVTSSSSSSPQVGNMFLPVPRMPQGILSLGVEEVVSTTNNNKNTTHLLFWAQSRAMQVFVYDLKKDILRMKNEEDDEDEEEEEEEHDDEESLSPRSSILQQLQKEDEGDETLKHTSASSSSGGMIIEIPVVAVIGPFNNFSFAPALCCLTSSSNSKNALIFLCPHEITFRDSLKSKRNSSSSKPPQQQKSFEDDADASSVTNGALFFSVIGENEMMSKNNNKNSKKEEEELHIAMRGYGELHFSSSSQESPSQDTTTSTPLPPKLGQLMMIERISINYEKEEQDRQLLFAASFESGDVVVFRLNTDLSRDHFYDSKISIEILAKVRVASEPIMSLMSLLSASASDYHHCQQSQRRDVIELLCGSAEGNLVLLEFKLNKSAKSQNVAVVEEEKSSSSSKSVVLLELHSTISKKIVSDEAASTTGIGHLIPLAANEHLNQDNSNDNNDALSTSTTTTKRTNLIECFLWNGERRRVKIMSSTTNKDDDEAEEEKRMSPTEIFISSQNSTAHQQQQLNFVVSAVCSSFDPKIIRLFSSVSTDAEVRKLGMKLANQRKKTINVRGKEENVGGTALVIARKGGELNLLVNFG